MHVSLIRLYPSLFCGSNYEWWATDTLVDGQEMKGARASAFSPTAVKKREWYSDHIREE